ncbi:bacterial transcriptional activator domain-containing protein [Litorilinea aerophila]|uniref:Transcriptional regulator n=1 Tax=Litorilinea aerophila TaxID=1204385 RepID=A0A540VF53_9CHLR|nr:bacterial transcriptional activator domain-containing protein [Litorilinea aerophila]MCC9076905.1 bacterial transcriptional activator domain-containing protein [Litorilinea aerophila]
MDGQAATGGTFTGPSPTAPTEAQPGPVLPARLDSLLADVPGYVSIHAPLRVQTLGGFRVWRYGEEILPGAWGREKALQLFQFFITNRSHYLHKEQIIDQLWPDLDARRGDRDFKVALNAVNKTLEPERTPWSEAQFIRRQGLAYGLAMEYIWLDSDVFELLIAAGNRLLSPQPADSPGDEPAGETPADEALAMRYLAAAVELYQGDYLPERRYEDWSVAERERLQVLALGTMTTLAGLYLPHNPLESVRLTQRVLAMDPVWEDAYRIQMRAYAAQGNRPLALRTYQQCVQVLQEEFAVDPLPETQELYRQILQGEL